MGAWKLLRLRPNPQLGRSYEPAFSKERPSFWGDREGCCALDGGILGFQDPAPKAETLDRIRSRECGMPYL